MRVLLDLHDTATRLLDDAAAIRVPTLVLAAGSDWVVERAAQMQFFERLARRSSSLELLPGYSHDVFHETDAERPLQVTRAFIAGAFARPPDVTPLLDAHERGYTFEEYRALARPLTPLSPKWIFYRVSAVSAHAGPLERRHPAGWESGFDSGRTLDYVYRNRAGGFTALGRIIDRYYLNGAGWRGVRVRRRLLERAVQQAIEQTHAKARSVHLVDIAAGAGRYLLETLTRCESLRVTAVLRDFEPREPGSGEAIARSLGLENVTLRPRGRLRPGLAGGRLRPRPDIAVVSGLYELFPDNTLIRRSLARLARRGARGRLADLHEPALAPAARVHRARVDRLGGPPVGDAPPHAGGDGRSGARGGFREDAQEIDQWGMFTVSLARRVS